MTPKPSTKKSRRLQMLRYLTDQDGEALQQALAEIAATEPALNQSFVTAITDAEILIAGLTQLGDILLRLTPGKRHHRVSIEFRQGDHGLVELLVRRLGKRLRPAKPTDEPAAATFHSLAQLLQALQRRPGAQTVLIAESAIESALVCRSLDLAAVLEALDFLHTSATVEGMTSAKALECRPRIRRLRQRHHRPAVAVHAGAKLLLPHRIQLGNPQDDSTLRLHFAALPDGSYLVGFVDEVAAEF